jgi:hypothetical protein
MPCTRSNTSRSENRRISKLQRVPHAPNTRHTRDDLVLVSAAHFDGLCVHVVVLGRAAAHAPEVRRDRDGCRRTHRHRSAPPRLQCACWPFNACGTACSFKGWAASWTNDTAKVGYIGIVDTSGKIEKWKTNQQSPPQHSKIVCWSFDACGTACSFKAGP